MNTKLQRIKAELAKMLVKFEVVKTDKGILQYEGEELKEGTVVKIENEDGTTEIPTGEFITEDNKKLIIENGEVKAIEEIEIEPVEIVEPVEEEPTTEETPEETPAEEETPAVEEAPEETPAEEETPAVEDVVPALEARIAELEAQLAEALAKLAELTEKTEEAFSKIDKFSLAKPAAAEFEQVKVTKKTGNAKIDKFMEKYGN